MTIEREGLPVTVSSSANPTSLTIHLDKLEFGSVTHPFATQTGYLQGL